MIARLAEILPDCVLVTADDNLPATHRVYVDRAHLTVATIDGRRPPRWVSDEPWRRDVVHRWAHRMAEQPPGSRRRYGLSVQEWSARRRKLRLATRG